MSIRILGNQPEPSLTEKGFEITDFEVRTNHMCAFIGGREMINDYIKANPVLEGCQFNIEDPMTVGIYPSKASYGEFNFDDLVLKLEKLGFYGKAAGYREVA